MSIDTNLKNLEVSNEFLKGGETIMIDPRLTNEFENEILKLIDNQDEYTRSDLQGIVTVLVNKIMESGYKIICNQKRTE